MKRKYELAAGFSRSNDFWADNIHTFRILLLPTIIVENSVNYIGVELCWLRWGFYFGIWKNEK